VLLIVLEKGAFSAGDNDSPKWRENVRSTTLKLYTDNVIKRKRYCSLPADNVH